MKNHYSSLSLLLLLMHSISKHDEASLRARNQWRKRGAGKRGKGKRKFGSGAWRDWLSVRDEEEEVIACNVCVRFFPLPSHTGYAFTLSLWYPLQALVRKRCPSRMRILVCSIKLLMSVLLPAAAATISHLFPSSSFPFLCLSWVYFMTRFSHSAFRFQTNVRSLWREFKNFTAKWSPLDSLLFHQPIG